MPLEIVVGAVVGAAATSAVSSAPIRKGLRKGVIYGLAGLLVAYDQVSAVAQGVVHGARRVVKSEADKPAEAPAAEAHAAPTHAATPEAPVAVSAPPG
jgi:hypothetical protein